VSPLVSIIVKLLEGEARKLAKLAMTDEPDKGRFLGRYVIVPVKVGDKKYLFEADTTDPLRFDHFASGYQFRPPDVLETDLGSIPAIAYKTIPRKYLRLDPADFVPQFVLHDAGCRNGWLWVRKGSEGNWRQMKISKKQADVMLAWTLSAPTLQLHPADPPPKSATRGEVQAIYRAVRMGHATRGQ